MEKIKPQEIKSKSGNIIFDTQQSFNQVVINDLVKIIKTNSSVPTHIPKKFIDCFYLYFDGTSTYELYIYISNSWKKVTLS